MANLTNVSVEINRLTGDTSASITVRVYEGDDPNNKGSLLYTNTFTDVSLGLPPVTVVKSFNVDVNASSFIVEIEPTELTGDVDFLTYPDLALTRIEATGADEDFSMFGDGAPYSDSAYSLISGAASRAWLSLTVSGEVKESGTKRPGVTNTLTRDDDPSPGGAVERSTRIAFVYKAGSLPEKATDPTPSDESDGLATTYETLSWKDGGEGEANAATSYDVYFKKGLLGSLEKVAEGIAETSLDMPDHVGTELNELTTYTWRVDSINEEGTTEGDEWTFTTSGVRGVGKARDPVPADEATDQSVNLSSLSFGDGEGATSYNVYFGLPDNLSLLGNVEYASQATSLAYQSLLANTTYNWRVDSVGPLGGAVTGDVWEFTTTSDFHPPDPTSGGPDDGTNSAFVTTRKLVAVAKDSFYYEDI